MMIKGDPFRETVIGFIIGVVTLLTIYFAEYQERRIFSAFLMIVILSIYIGFTLMKNDFKSNFVEIGVATAFLLLTIYGYYNSTFLLIFLYPLHALWDIIHHTDFSSLSKIPDWYPTFCASVDVIIGVGLIFLL